MKRLVALFVPMFGACGGATIARMPCADGRVAPGDAELLASLELEGEPDEGAVPLARGFAIGESDVRADLTIRAGRCLGFSVALSRGIVDADLDVFDPQGERLGVDDGPDRFARVRICAGEDARVVVRARAAGGAGDLAILASPSEGPRPDTPASVARFGRSAADALTARGFRVAPLPPSVLLDAGVPLRVPIVVAPTECVTAIVRSEAEVELRLLDDREQAIVEDAGRDRDLRIEHCSVPGARGASIELRSSVAAEVRIAVGRADAVAIGGRAGLGGGR